MPNLPPRPRIERIGHRGAPREYPENSLPSFARAIELGADAIELDVHLTADGVVVVHHDPDIHHKTGPRRRNRTIRKMTWSELSRIELAPGVQVPTLAEVLTLCGTRIVAYVELKGVGSEEAALEVIRASSARCAVHSFDHAMIERAARLAPEVRRGILFDEYPEDVERSMDSASALDVWPRFSIIDRGLVDRVHAAAGRVIAWTVNATADAEGLRGLGVDGLCGDDVRLLAYPS